MPERTVSLKAALRRNITAAVAALTAACLIALAMGVASAQAEIFYSSQTRIGKIDLDGTNKNPDLITGRSSVADIAVDENYVYWAEDVAGGGIYRANHDGTGVTTLIGGLSRPRGLAVDDQYLYYGTYNTTTIGRANLDGTGNSASFVTGVTTGASSIAVNDTHIFWSRWNTGGTNAGIGRANIDGTGVTPNYIATTPAASPAWYASTGGVDVNDTHIYWANWDGASGSSVGRAKLDGSEKQRNLITPIEVPFGIAVDDSHVYWGVQYGNAYGRADLDGGNKVNSFITGVDNYPYGLAVLPESRTSSTTVSCTPDPVALGAPASCTATVTDAGGGTPVTPTGTATFSSDGSGAFMPIEGECELVAGEAGAASCSVNYTPSAVGSETITADYAGSSGHSGSSNTTTLNTEDPPHPAYAVVSCTPQSVVAGTATNCRATISDHKANGYVPPSGQVNFTVDGPGSFAPASNCELAATTDRASECEVSFTPTQAGVFLLTATYAGTAQHVGGADDVATLTVGEAHQPPPDEPQPEPTPPPAGDGGTPAPPANQLRLSRGPNNAKTGRAVLIGNLPSAGRLVLSGPGVQRATGSRKAGGNVRLVVRAKGATLRKLRNRGSVRVRVRVAFRPAGDGPARTRNNVLFALRMAR